MKIKLLMLPILLAIAVFTPSPALAANCTTQPYCDWYCPTATRTSVCCCPGGTAAAGKTISCKYYDFGLCNDPCWGQGPGCGVS